MSIPQEVARDLRLHYLQLLLWGIQIQQGRLEPKHAHLVRSFALDHIRRCQSLLAGAGVLPHRNRREWEAFQDAERTLVGFFDWAGRGQMPEQWEPLQTELYGNEKVGELVMAQMEALAQSQIGSDYPTEALEVQARCLELGYCGLSATRRMSQLQIDDLKSKLTAALRRPLPELSPALPPLLHGSQWRPRLGPLGIVGTAAVLLAVLGGGLRLMIYLRTGTLAAQIEQKLPTYGCR